MSKTLDEFVESYGAIKHLKKNLKTNIDVFCENWDEGDKETFLRMNLIMVRECLQDFGVE